MLSSSILLITSDHGELLDDKAPNFSHGVTAFQPESRAVCMLRHAGQGAPKGRVEAVVSTIDFLPTLLDALNLDLPPRIEGETILFRDTAGAIRSRIRFGDASQPTRSKSAESGWFNRNNAQYVRDGSLKLIRIPHLDRERLFDLAQDPGERHDLLAAPTPSQAVAARRLGALLDGWRPTHPTLSSRYIKGEKNDTEARLRALGYIE